MTLDVTELEQLLFPDGKRPSEMTVEDFGHMSALLDDLVDRYGEDRISAMLRELTALTGAQIRAMLHEREP